MPGADSARRDILSGTSRRTAACGQRATCQAGPSTMRTMLVGIALVLAACMHGTPKDNAVETTFPVNARAPELPRQLRVVTINLHKAPGAKILRGLLAAPALRDADLI